MIHGLDIVVLTQFLKDRHIPAMRAGINRDLPGCISPSKLVGSSPHLITPKALGSRVQVSSGTIETSTTTSNNTKFQVATREDVCLSLPVATMTSRWIILASTPG